MMAATEPKVWILGKPLPREQLLKEAAHGDLVLDPPLADRTLGVWFVQGLNEEGKTLKKNKMVQRDITGSGYASVPLEITRHFADPVARYLSHLSIRLDSQKEEAVRRQDWYSIELDAAVHADLLQQQTGGRAVAANRQVTYFVNDFGAGQGYCIYNPETEAEGNNMVAWKPLNEKTPDRYLQKKVYRKTAAEFTKEQQKNADLFETRFLKYLQAHPDELVTLRGIPKDINKYEQEGGMMTNGKLIRIEPAQGGALPEILVRYTEWVEDPEKKENVPVDHDLTFIPTILTKKGRFGNVHFWIEKESNWMLFPPLYKLKK